MDDTRATNASEVRIPHVWHACVTCCRSSIPRTSHADVVHMMRASYARHSSSKCDVKQWGSDHFALFNIFLLLPPLTFLFVSFGLLIWLAPVMSLLPVGHLKFRRRYDKSCLYPAFSVGANISPDYRRTHHPQTYANYCLARRQQSEPLFTRAY
jgi:hypothetical protein